MTDKTPGKPAASVAARLLTLPIHFYRLSISPMLPASCRFTPTCSQYALDAIRLHGAAKGSLLALRRLSRCHPWGGSGFDPVPDPEREQTDDEEQNRVNIR